ncbi:MAG TPA: amidohydrolase family protein [Gammaproteobacteria bacterium]|nr:amidohydrolase family protein [Gammaproteobacteria bacterium]
MQNPSFRRVAIASAWLGLLAAAACTQQAAENAAAPAQSTAVAFEGARVIVGDESAPIENAVLVVDGARFVAVGKAGEVAIPPGAKRVSLSGKTVMPAIVDTHTHLNRERDALVLDLQRRAYFGVSAALSLGQDNGDVVYAMQREQLPGAALYRTAGRGITAPEPGRNEVPYWIKTADEGRAGVREQAALGVEIIKVWVDDRNGTYPKLGPELYGAVIDEAHKNGLRAIAHVYTLEDAKGLVRAGIDAFAHGVRDKDIDDEYAALVKERPNLVLGPNLPDRGVVTDLGWLRGIVPPAVLDPLQAAATDRPDAQAFFGIQARNLARLSAQGMRIVLGTDGNTPWGPHLEMEDMVAAGMTPAQVLTAATRNSAEFLRLDAGTVAAGKSADFLVLDANPLDDITNTRRIAAVYLRGAAVDRDAVRTAWQ